MEEEENKEERTRTDYGIEEKEMEFDIDDKKEYERVPDDYKSILENPINSTLSSFWKINLINERNAYDLFQQMRELWDEFSALTTDSPYYENSQIVVLIKRIINAYNLWVSSFRQNIFLMRDTIKNITKVIEKEYMTLGEHEKLRGEYEEQVNDLKNYQEKPIVLKIEKFAKDRMMIMIPRKYSEELKVGMDVSVFKRNF